MDSFLEALNRLKDTHEAEVLGLQNRLLELNSERCRDAQRVSELCAKNQQLREQQKVLKENLRVLENRLRAGLCDRCLVTQELARKKQQEFETSLLQSLRHLFVLTNEMNRLQEENGALKEEVKRLRGAGPSPPGRERVPDPPSPLLLPAPGAWKAVTKKPPGGQEEAQDHPPEESTLPGASPVARTSPRAGLPEPRAVDASPQCISNQLHGTVALVRPGSWTCPTDRGSSDGTPPLPPTGSTPSSPPLEHSLALDSFLQASRSPAGASESLKRSVQASHLCLLNRHLSLKLWNPHSSPRGPASALRGPRSLGLKARETEAWEEPAGPGVDERDPQLEEPLHLLLAQQLREQLGNARLRGPPTPGGAPPSPPAGSDSEGPEGQGARTGLSSPRGEEATGDCIPDKPLDLSEWGRGRDAPKPTVRPGSRSPPASHAPSPKPLLGAEPPALTRSPWALSGGAHGARVPEPEEPPTAKDPTHALPAPRPSLPSPGGPGGETRGRPRPSPRAQGPEADGPPAGLADSNHQPGLTWPPAPRSPCSAEPREADGQWLDPDTSDSEVGLSPPRSLLGEGPRCFCGQEHGPGQRRKRKWASEPWTAASEKPRPGKRNPRESPAGARGPGSPREPASSSHSLDSSSCEEA